MAFSSFPAIYFDHANSQQFQHQQDHHQHGSGERSQIQLQPPTERVVGGASPHGGSSIRAGSMIDLARIAQVPLPEAGLKCPRCDSSNTKFCYYNNYNLLQPRYMCKTCRRYWTKGGTLRKVPVGGGTRKNKKTKSSSSSSKPSIVSSDMQMGANSTGTKAPYTTTLTSNFPQFPLMAAGGSPIRSNLSSRFPANMGFSLGSNFGGNANYDLSSVGVAETSRLSLIPGYMGEGINGAFSSSMDGNQQLAGSMAANSTGVSRNSNGKSEECPTENITREFYINSDNCQFWGDHENPWIGFSDLSSSSTGHLL